MSIATNPAVTNEPAFILLPLASTKFCADKPPGNASNALGDEALYCTILLVSVPPDIGAPDSVKNCVPVCNTIFVCSGFVALLGKVIVFVAVVAPAASVVLFATTAAVPSGRFLY